MIKPLFLLISIIASTLVVANEQKITACGDLFNRFSTLPPHLEFLACEHFENSQTITAARYRVTGQFAEVVEKYLIENYQMPPMKIFQHTGYEPSGYGNIEIEALKKINPYMGVYIEMYGNARKEPVYDKDGEILELGFTLLPKQQVPYFYIIVSIMVI